MKVKEITKNDVADYLKIELSEYEDADRKKVENFLDEITKKGYNVLKVGHMYNDKVAKEFCKKYGGKFKKIEAKGTLAIELDFDQVKSHIVSMGCNLDGMTDEKLKNNLLDIFYVIYPPKKSKEAKKEDEKEPDKSYKKIFNGVLF